MVKLTGRLICSSIDHRQAIKAHLPEHVRLSRAEPGCIFFAVTPSADAAVWQVEERFVDRAAFDAHQRRTQNSAWGQATAGIAREYQVLDEEGE